MLPLTAAVVTPCVYWLLHTVTLCCTLPAAVLSPCVAAGRALTVLVQVRIEPFRKFSIDFTCRVIEYVMGVRELTGQQCN